MRLRRRHAEVVLSVLLLAGAATACGSGGGNEPEASGGQSSTSAASPTTTAPNGERPSVVLDDAGREPRQPLVLQLAAGTTTTVALVTKLGVQLTLDGERLPGAVVPNTRVVLTQQVDKVDPDGTAHYRLTVTDAAVIATEGADPTVVSQTSSALNELKGLKGTGAVGARGEEQDQSFDTRTITNPLLKSTVDSISSQMSNLSAPFPGEPVGPGARWTATRSTTINGITMNMTSRYTLRSRTGTRYEVDVVQDATAPPGPAAVSNLPTGASMSVTSFTVHSTGRLAGDLTRALPTSSSASGTGDGIFTVSQGSDRTSIKQHLDLDFTISPA